MTARSQGTNKPTRLLALSPIFATTSLVLAACGGAAAAPSGVEESGTAAGESTGGEAAVVGVEGISPDEQTTIDGFDSDLDRLNGDFEGALQLTDPNCPRAGELRDAICDLADRICDIASRHPEHTDVSDRCETGRTRCERARGDVEEACG